MPLSQYYDTGWYEPFKKMTGASAILDTREIRGRSSGIADRRSNVITFIARIPYSGSSKEGAAILNVNAGILNDLLKNITAGNQNSLAFLINDDGTILSSNRESYSYANIYDTLGIKPELLNRSAGSFRSHFNGTMMFSYYETSSVNSWKLVYMQPEHVIFQKSSYIKAITFLILFMLLVFTIISSFYFSFRVYNPIRNIVAGIRAKTSVRDEDISDITLIGGSLDKLYDNNRKLEEQLRQNKLLMRENFFNQLITGKLFNKNEILVKADYFSIDLDFDCFKVAVIQNGVVRTEPSDMRKFEYDKVSIINFVTKVLSSQGIDVVCSQDTNENILILLGFRSVIDLKEIEAYVEQALEDIRDSIEEYQGLSVSIGIGGTHTELPEAGLSYKEAMRALHYKFLSRFCLCRYNL
jgi:hypothetical protein